MPIALPTLTYAQQQINLHLERLEPISRSVAERLIALFQTIDFAALTPDGQSNYFTEAELTSLSKLITDVRLLDGAADIEAAVGYAIAQKVDADELNEIEEAIRRIEADRSLTPDEKTTKIGEFTFEIQQLGIRESRMDIFYERVEHKLDPAQGTLDMPFSRHASAIRFFTAECFCKMHYLR